MRGLGGGWGVGEGERGFNMVFWLGDIYIVLMELGLDFGQLSRRGISILPVGKEDWFSDLAS